MAELATLGVVDYVVFSIVLAISFVIGILSSLKANNTTADFLTANRSMHYLPVGFSLLTSFISSISLLGMSGDAYANGIQLYLFVIGALGGMYITTFTSLPVFSALHLTSMNEYLMMRFKSKQLKNFVSVVFIIKKLLYMGICLYAPTIALAAVTSLDIYTYIYILGIVCTLYSSVGGMRAVVWTDVFQLFVMAVGLIVVVSLACVEAGGLGEVWRIASEGNRTDLFEMDPDPRKRYSFWNTLVMGVAVNSFVFGIDQLNLQRISSVPDEKSARKLLVVTGIGFIILYIFVFLGGIATYAVYVGCDPLTIGILSKKEEILPYFVMDRVSYLYGLPGLFISTLFCGTLSSLSSALNGAVALFWKDLFEGLSIFKNASTATTTLFNKFLSLVLGLATIGIAVLCSKSSSLIDFSMTISGVLTGPVYGVFLLGLLVPGCATKGAWAGMLISWGFILWIALGASLYAPPPGHLPYSVESCNATEDFSHIAAVANWTGIDHTYSEFTESPYMMELYRVSYTLYTPISTVMSFLIGLLVTHLTGYQDLRNVSPNLISPFIRKRHWEEPTELVKVLLHEKNIQNDIELKRKLMQ